MSREVKDKIQDDLDNASLIAVQTLEGQLTCEDKKIANKAANDLLEKAGFHPKAVGTGGPSIQINLGDLTAGLREVKEIMTSGKVEVLQLSEVQK